MARQILKVKMYLKGTKKDKVTKKNVFEKLDTEIKLLWQKDLSNEDNESLPLIFPQKTW